MKPKLCVSVLMILCLSLILSADQTLPQVKKFPHLDLNSLEIMKSNGEYVISVWKDGCWQEAGRLAYDRFLRERELDLSPYLAGTDAPKIKITEQGPGAAHIDSVLLGGRPPEAAEGPDSGRILRKLSVKDNDIINAQGKSLELAFAKEAADKTLKLAARIESAKVGTEPLRFPYDNLFTKIRPHSKFYSYALNESAPAQGAVGSGEYLKAVGQRPPFFKVFAPTSSGHPSGFTYGWVSNDEKNLYVTLDFTPDNTYDGDKDYAKVYVNTGGEVKEFKVSVPETKYGNSHFTYTDKVAYEHKVYDFVIPLSEVGAVGTGRELKLAFAAYGTAAATAKYPSLAFDPDHKRYLLVFEVSLEGGFDIIGILLDLEGNEIEVAGQDWFMICDAENSQVFPDVAYDSLHQCFLVVWQDDRDPPTAPDIYGQLVNPDGELIGDNFPIKADSEYEQRPAVANDSVNHQFLVVWEDGREFANGTDIWGQLVSGEGALVPPAAIKARALSTANGITDFVISDALEDQTEPDVAFDAQANAYLVVFTDQEGDLGLAQQAIDAVPTFKAIKGQLISWNGASLYHDTDVNFLISDPACAAVNPAIANDNINHRFLVAWADFPSGGIITSQTQETQRTPGDKRIQAIHPSHGIQGSSSTQQSHENQLSQEIHRTQGTWRSQGTQRAQRAQAILNDQPFIYGQLVDTAANLVREERFLISDVSDEGYSPEDEELHRSNPAVAFDNFNRNYLVFWYCQWWEDDEDDGAEVEGRLINDIGLIASGYLWTDEWDEADRILDVAPAVAYNSFCRNFLVAWPCWCGEVHWEIVGPEECAFLPEVTTTAITQITNISATSGGNVTSDGGAEVTVRGVCWNTTGGPTTGDSLTSNGSGLGTFISQMTGLNPNTKYYVRAYATNSVGTAYGNELTFTALNLPQVTTTAVTQIIDISATSGGNVTSDGGAEVTARGVCWNTTGGPTTGDSLTSNGSGLGTFISQMTGLSPNTKYFVRAYATNSVGTAYGNELTFTTLNLPEVTTTAVTHIIDISATSGGNVTSDGGAEVTARGVCWNTNGRPTTRDSQTSNGSGLGTFISQMTGLSPNTKYFVRAYAANIVGTAYGNELTFSTLRQFKVTFVAGTGGTLSGTLVQVVPEGGSGTLSGTLVQVVPEGGNCTPVEAKADTGFCFINWTGTTGFAGSSANPLTVTNVRQDMTITANFGKLALVVQKLTEQAWIVKQYYGKIVLNVDGLDPAIPIRYVLNRKQGGGEYKALKEFTSSDLQNNTYTYEDKFLEAEVTYIYQVVAYNASGQVIGRSDEITVR